jgi:nitrogen fixation protein NifU and related proteins
MATDRQTQIELLLEHYNHPCCRWKMDRPDVAMPGGNPGCGDVVTIYTRFEESSGEPGKRRLDQVSFVGSGCTISQAAASILMEKLSDQSPTVEEVLDMSYEDVIDELGREVVETRPRCATLALGTLKAAARKYLRDEQRRAAGLPVDSPAGLDLEAFEAS